MTGDAESGKGRGGLFGSIGRLFGGGRRDDASANDASPEAAGDDAPGPAEAARWTGPAPSADDEDDEEALVLGPSLKAPAAPDDSEDELTLVADTRTASGEEGDAWAGDASLAEGDEGPAEELPEAEDLIARLRAGDERDQDEAFEGAPATAGADSAPSEDDRPESGQTEADRPEAARTEDGQTGDGRGGEELSDEDALVARLRAMGGDQWSGFDGSEANDDTPSGDAGAGEADPAEAAPTPQEGHISGFSWLSGEEREDGKGTTPASDAGPEGRETMEAEEMGREDETETETDDDARSAATEAPGAVLFPGAMAATGEHGREDGPEEADSGAKPEGAEETSEAAEPDPADAAAGSEETRDAATDPESGDDAAGPDTPVQAAPATEADDDATAGASRDTTRSGENAGEADSGRDSAEAEVLGLLAASSAEPGEATASGEPGEGAGGDAVAFEESVRRLIREELEGEMGERLSRNIRKMIRDEVAHALLRNR